MDGELNISYYLKKIGKTQEYFKKNKKKIILLFLIMIPIIFSIYFRIYAYSLPIADDYAERSVESQIRGNFRTQILANYPEINPTDLENLVNQNYKEAMEKDKKIIEEAIAERSSQFRDYYQDDSGQTYLLAIDPYYYLRQARNIDEYGSIGDDVKDGKPFDNHMLAPNGRFANPTLHPYLIFFSYKLMSLFGNNSIMSASFILPLILIALSIIPCFFITKRLVGNVGAFFASSVLAINTSVLTRTPAGFSDTDAYNILFPLTIVWLLIESFRAKSPRKKLLFAGLSGCITGLYSFAWGGWWYIFDFIMATTLIYMLFLVVKYKKNIFKKRLPVNFIKNSTTYLISTIIFVTFINGFSSIMSAIKGPLNALFLKQAAHKTLWPNVYTTVAELNEASFTDIISSLGGNLLFSLSIIGIILLVSMKRHRIVRLKYSILFTIWFLGTFYISTKGMRFILLLAPVYCIGLGITVGTIYKKLKKWLVKELDLNKVLVTSMLICIITISLVPMLIKADEVSMQRKPDMNDVWFNSLNKIKMESSENSIINSWWDFGHWFKYFADRQVTFDGASQNTPMAHWIGKVLITNNEEEAIGILRMLDCGGNDAYELIFNETKEELRSIEIVYSLVNEDKQGAIDILNNNNLESEKIIEKTHCNPPDNYFITSQDMVPKSQVWSHFGSWNFTRSYIYNLVKRNSRDEAINNLQEELDYSEEKAIEIYNEVKSFSEQEVNGWISPYPSYSTFGNCVTESNTVQCSNGLIFNSETKEAVIVQNQEQILIKYLIIEGVVYENENGADIAAAYIGKDSTSLFMDSRLRESIFTKLFFFEGKNQQKFELFSHETGIDGFKIYIWKVVW